MTDARDFDLELDMLSAYLDGELAHDERAAINARLQESAEWRAELAAVESARSLVRALPTRDAPPGFWDRVVALVEAAERDADDSADAEGAVPVPITAARGARRSTTERPSRLWWLAGAAAAVAALVVVVLPNRDAVKPNVTAVVTQHGASTSDAGDPISGLAPVGPLAGFRR